MLAALLVLLSMNGTATAGDPPVPPSKVTLGSAAAAVAARFGKPLKDFGPAKLYVPCDGSENGAKWGVTFRGDEVTAIQRSACGDEHLDATSVKKEATSLMPSDAKLARDFRTPDGREAHEYRSASLAKKFPSADFVTCDAEGRITVVPEGTLSYAMASDGRSWIVILGSCF